MSEWISVNDRLPDNDSQTEVVFYAKPYEWWTGLYTQKGFAGEPDGHFQYHQHWGDDQYHTIDGVICWMPLPNPPNDQE